MFLAKDLEHGVSGHTDYEKLPTLAEAVAKLKSQLAAEKPLDVPTEFSGLTMSEDGALIHESTKIDMAYTKHCLSQAVSRIKPVDVVGMAGYLAACPPDLRSLNFNFWHQEFYGPEVTTPQSNEVVLRLVRRDQQLLARAVVSKLYVPLDDLPIVQTLNELLPQDGRARFTRGDNKSYYSMFWMDKNEVIDGDEIIAGVRVINSETGSSGAYIMPIYYSRKTGGCIIMNGVHARKNLGIRHVGEAERKVTGTYKKVVDSVETNLKQLREAATDYPLGFDTPAELATAISKYLTLPMEAVIKALDSCSAEKPSRVALASAIAAQAHDVHISNAEDIEIAAGRLLDVSWNTLGRHKHVDL
jgi:hypothetical protein